MMVRENIHHKLFLILIALTVVTLPFSIKLCSLCIILLTLNWLVEGNFKTKWQMVKRNKLIWLFCGFYIFHVIGLLWTQDLTNGLFDLEKKLSLFIFPIVVGTSAQLSPKGIKTIFNTFIVTCIAAILLSLLSILSGPEISDPEHLNFDYLNKDKFRISSSGGADNWNVISYIGLSSAIQLHPTYFSLYISFAIALLLYQCRHTFSNYNSFKKTIIVLTALIFVIALAFLSSRVVIVAFLILSIISLGYFLLRKQRYVQGALYSFAFITLIMSLIYVNPVTRFRVIQEPLNTDFSYPQEADYWNSWSLRMLEWNSSIKIIKNNWLVGVGTGDTQKHLNEEYAKVELGIFGSKLNAHNQYLQTAISIGAIGFLIILSSFIWPAVMAWQNGHIIYLIFIFLFGMCCLSESMLQTQKGVVFYALFNSLLAFQVFPQDTKRYA